MCLTVTKVPFFHYTHINNLMKIIKTGQLRSRGVLNKAGSTYQDISIDPEQRVRTSMGLDEYIPLFVGYYSHKRSRSLWKYLRNNYEKPKIQNKRFYGSLHKTLKEKMDADYPNISILLVKFSKLCSSADSDELKYFNDLAIKNETNELHCHCKSDLLSNIKQCITTNPRGKYEIVSEVDVLDTPSNYLIFPQDFEAIILNDETRVKKVIHEIKQIHGENTLHQLKVFVHGLP